MQMSKLEQPLLGTGSGADGGSAGAAAPAAPLRSRWAAALNFRQHLADLLRSTSGEGSSKFTALDGVRAWACLWVLIFHCWWINSFLLAKFSYPRLDVPTIIAMLNRYNEQTRKWYFYLPASGDSAVDCFFVLSGFLISHVLFSEFRKTRSINVGRFLLRRLLRLWPALLFAVALTAIVGPTQEVECGGMWWRVIFFIFNLPFWDISKNTLCVAQAWSVCVEMQFYLLSPLIVWSFCKSKRSGYIALAIGLLFTLACRFGTMLHFNLYEPAAWTNPMTSANDAKYMYETPWTRAAGYIAGMWANFVFTGHYGHDTASTGSVNASDSQASIAVLVDAAPSPAKKAAAGGFENNSVIQFLWRWHWVLTVTSAVTLFLAMKHDQDLSALAMDNYSNFTLGLAQVFARCAFSFSLAVLLLLALTGKSPILNRVLSHPFWYPFAQLSYSAYLLQFIVILNVDKYWLPLTKLSELSIGSYALVCLVNIPLIYVLAVLSFVFIEKPVMALRW